MCRRKHESRTPLVVEHSKFFRDLLLGFVKVHILHYASRKPIYGLGIRDDLDRHGYQLSEGTIYPLLHSLDAAAFLHRDDIVVDGKMRKYYEITPLGTRALEEARRRLGMLLAGIMHDEWPAPDPVSRPR